ncbi:hypothetical protein BH11PLA2_BH11PLA2_33380 [soil metagenome]
MIAALLTLATLTAGYYALTMLAGLFQRTTTPSSSPSTRFAILVPAHNEALSLPVTLVSLAKLDYPVDLVSVFVIADNCTDDTASVARNHGVGVLERHEPDRRGKGYALEFALKQILPTRPDAVLILDADGELDSQSLHIFDARLQKGASVVQGSIRTRNAAAGPTSLVAAVGNVMDDRVSAGRDVLRMRVPLRGSNMVFARSVFEEHPWQSYGLTEDAEYSEILHRASIRVQFEAAAKAVSESAANVDALCQQRRRWRASLNSLVTVIDSKPIVLLQFFVTTVAVLLYNEVTYTAWLAAIVLVTMGSYISALFAVGVSNLQSLFAIPGVIARLVMVTLGGLFHRETTWQRTQRAVES